LITPARGDPRSGELSGAIMTKVWKYLERHHDEYGVALFIVPVLVLALVVVGVCCAMSAVVGS
jgi:hypothetical protein